MDRRQFIKGGAALAAMAAGGGAVHGAKAGRERRIWGLVLHLGTNMWSDVRVADRVMEGPRKWGGEDGWALYSDVLRFDEAFWRETTARMAAKGLNTIVLDLGEGLCYPSHPELSVEGTWPVAKMKDELRRLRGMGLEVVPKLNFSTGHDTWLQKYGRMVSTKRYYDVCRDVILDTVDAFDGPELFHMGFDEETARHQSTYDYCVVRQGELWWHDCGFFVDTIKSAGARPWMWSDKIWHSHEDFVKRVPKDVLQSNWYYGHIFDPEKVPPEHRERVRPYIEAFKWLEEAGYDQVPTGMAQPKDDVDGWKHGFAGHCAKTIAPARLKGMLNSVWCFTMPHKRDFINKAIDEVAEASRYCGAQMQYART